MEYAQAKNTFCRSCGRHFEIGATRKVVGPKPAIVPKAATKAPSPATAAAQSAEPIDAEPEEDKPGWLASFLPSKQPRDVKCFDCGTAQRVMPSARSSNCPKCGAYIDLQDIKVNSPFSRNFRTHGHLYVGPKGICNSVRAECGSAKVEGELGGNLTCAGILELRRVGRMPGAIKARTLIVHRKTEAQFGRPIKATDVDIAGDIRADIHAEGTVRIRGSGSLHGSVTAKSLVIEKGAVFEGQATITPPDKPGLRAMLLSQGKGPIPRNTAAAEAEAAAKAEEHVAMELPLDLDGPADAAK